MAYPTEEDDALLAERGFDKTKSGYIRKQGLETHGIEPTGATSLYSLDVPVDEVRWSAWCVIANSNPDVHDSFALVVPHSDAAPTPSVAYVTAEVRQWRRG